MYLIILHSIMYLLRDDAALSAFGMNILCEENMSFPTFPERSEEEEDEEEEEVRCSCPTSICINTAVRVTSLHFIFILRVTPDLNPAASGCQELSSPRSSHTNRDIRSSRVSQTK